MTRSDKIEVITRTARQIAEQLAFRRANLSHRFERWGETTSEIFLETMEGFGFTIARQAEVASTIESVPLVTSARILEATAKEYQRKAEEIKGDHARVAGATLLADADAFRVTADLLWELSGKRNERG